MFNVLVFQTSEHSKIDGNIDGICISEDSCINNAILINRYFEYNTQRYQYSDKRKSFTLLHELYHLIGFPDFDNTFIFSKDHIEKECNNFASQILLPNNIFDKMSDKSSDWNWNDLKSIRKLCKDYNISTQHFLTRLLKSKKISQDEYTKLSEDEEVSFKESLLTDPPKKSGGGGDGRGHLYKKRNRLGRNYIRSVYNIYAEDEITMSKALSLLEIKSKDFEKLVELV